MKIISNSIACSTKANPCFGIQKTAKLKTEISTIRNLLGYEEQALQAYNYPSGASQTTRVENGITYWVITAPQLAKIVAPNKVLDTQLVSMCSRAISEHYGTMLRKLKADPISGASPRTFIVNQKMGKKLGRAPFKYQIINGDRRPSVELANRKLRT